MLLRILHVAIKKMVILHPGINTFRYNKLLFIFVFLKNKTAFSYKVLYV